MTVVSVAAGLSTVILGILYLRQAWDERPVNKSFADYFFHRWSLGARQVANTLFSSAMSLATVVIAFLQLAGVFGVALCYATLTFCVGWYLIQRAAPRICARAQRADTLHSFLGRFFQSRMIQSGAAVVTTIGLLGLFATELFAVDVMVRSIGLKPSLATPLIGLFGIFAIVHASLGGFRAVVRSDKYQNFLLLLSLLVLLVLSFFVWGSAGFPTLPYRGSAGSLMLPASLLVGLFMINVPFPFVDTLTWQRLIAAASSSEYIAGSRYAIIGFCMTWTILVFIGLLTAAAGPTTEPLSFLVGYCNSLPKPVGFALILMLFPGLIAALLSSSDAFLNSAAHTWCLDVAGYRRFQEEDFVRDRASRHVIWLGLLGLLGALWLRGVGFNIVGMMFAVYAGTLALVPAVVHAIAAKPGDVRPHLKSGALFSMFVGLTAAWTVGLAATVESLRNSGIVKSLATIIPIDVYQAPTYAVIVSTIVYLTASFVGGRNRLWQK